jgi:WD40 repeat protein
VAGLLGLVLVETTRVRFTDYTDCSKPHTKSITSLVLSHDGTTLYSASDDGSVQAHDASDLSRHSILYQGSSPVESLSLSRDGHYLGAGAGDGQVVRINLTDRSDRRVSELGAAGPTFRNTVLFSPDGAEIYTTRESAVVAFDVELRTFRTLRTSEQFVSSLAASPDGSIIAIGEAFRAIRLHHLATGHETTVAPLVEDSIPALAFSPDGRLLAVVDTRHPEMNVDIFTTRDWRRVHRSSRPRDGAPESLAFSPSGDSLALVGTKMYIKLMETVGRIVVIDPTSMKERYRFRTREEIMSAVFARDGKSLYAGDSRGALFRLPVPAQRD